MSLFQKKPSVENSTPPYKIDFVPGARNNFGMEVNLLIIGLGNAGKEYSDTRHNIGFDVINYFASKNDFPTWSDKKNLKAEITINKIGDNRIILAKPTTYMNASGEAVQAIQNFYKVDNSKTLIVHDEIDINFGSIRTRMGGKDAGHNGIKSIINSCGEEFGRVRIGIGPKRPTQIDSADFVLHKFSSTQQKQLPNLHKETLSILSEYIYGAGKLEPETRSFIV